MEISLAEASSMFPGFRFSPTDEELISYYLKKKVEGSDSCVEVIPEVDICKYEPWDLPANSIIRADNEWFFFSPRGRKYPNGSQSKRATECGYWKATGKERSVKSGSTVIGTKRTLVFHTGRAPKGQRTEWIMHEYCMNGKSQDLMVVCRLRKNSEFNLDDTPRKKSLERRHSKAVNNTATALSGIDQDGIHEVTTVADSSKECTSSFNSHSVEQIDSGIESDGKITNDFPPHASSSHQNVQESDSNEEDCFADIMKDDIIKLDDSHILRMVARESESKKKNKQPAQITGPGKESESKNKNKQPAQINAPGLPFQGTANRRLRLRRQNLDANEAVQLTPHELKNVFYTKKLVTCIDSQRSSKFSIGLFFSMGFKCLATLVFLTLLVLFFLFVHFTKLQFISS